MIKLLNNRSKSVQDIVREGLGWCDEFRVATAFLSNGGYNLMSEDILKFAERGGRIRLVVGLDNYISDYNAILEFATLVGDCKCKLFIALN